MWPLADFLAPLRGDLALQPHLASYAELQAGLRTQLECGGARQASCRRLLSTGPAAERGPYLHAVSFEDSWGEDWTPQAGMQLFALCRQAACASIVGQHLLSEAPGHRVLDCGSGAVARLCVRMRQRAGRSTNFCLLVPHTGDTTLVTHCGRLATLHACTR